MSTVREKIRQGMPLDAKELQHYDHLLSSARSDGTSYTPRALLPDGGPRSQTQAPRPGAAVNQAATTAAAGQVPTTPSAVPPREAGPGQKWQQNRATGEWRLQPNSIAHGSRRAVGRLHPA